MTKVDISQYPYPRRQPLRRILRQMARTAFAIISDFHIIGRENIPKTPVWRGLETGHSPEISRRYLI